MNRLRASNIGPITEADVRFGDLTVFVGPQATGKSIFLQLLKLLVDRPAIHRTMKTFGISAPNSERFFDLYFGEGMSSIWSENSALIRGQEQTPTDLATYARAGSSRQPQRMFYIPAQRVMSLRDGMTRPFNDYRSGDPYVLRHFSQELHEVVQNEVGPDDVVFPRTQRLSKPLRQPIIDHIFGGFGLRTDSSTFQPRLVLKHESGAPLPYLVWSAGQREFVPLLLGLYWLMPPSRVPRREDLDWVVIEEPEMGLHPDGIGAVLGLVLELRRRGYRICLSTHSPHVLDIVWALRLFQGSGGQTSDVLNLLGLSSVQRTRELAESALQSDLKTFFFARDGEVRDISDLDPGAESTAESGWGGLTGFSSQVGDVVAEVVDRESAAVP
jgi:hypothetical protein